MTKLYGGRWKITGNISGGGQGDVFRVTDESMTLPGEYALKRLRDVTRLDRFKNEIAALKQLDHPNIVKLLDHSDLSQTATPHFLVMPLAAEGDADRRLALFEGNVENVVQVALQMAHALAAAHQAVVVHRDVKPGNILFPSQGLDIWLSDFGICHLQKEVRDTPTGAVMGPRRFAAPEVEEGISDVPFHVDIYSLGQVIFYLLSNGRTFYRENVHSSDHNAFFPTGERVDLLRMLLGRMVAPGGLRIQTMKEVIAGLTRIKDWSSTARASVLDDEAAQLIINLRRTVQENEQHRIDFAKAKADREAVMTATKASITALIKRDLELAATQIGEGGDLAARVSEERTANGLRLGATTYSELTAFRLSLSKIPRAKSLYMMFCQKRTTQIRVTQADAPRPILPSIQDTIFTVIPVFAETEVGRSQPTFFFVVNDRRLPLSINGPYLSVNSQNRFSASSRVNTLTTDKINVSEFSLADWPEVQPELSHFIGEAVKMFLKEVTVGRKQ